MRGTKEAMRILGKAGEIVDREDLPEDYDIELSFRYGELMDLYEECSCPAELVKRIREKQARMQADFEQAKERVERELDSRIPDGTTVNVDSEIHDYQGTVGGVIVDHGRVYYEVYDGKEKLGGFRAGVVNPVEEFETESKAEGGSE